VETLHAWQMEGFPRALSRVRKLFLLTLTLLVGLSLSESDRRGLKPFEDNLYANLLMRAVSGSLYPEETFPGVYVSPDFPKQVTTLFSGMHVIWILVPLRWSLLAYYRRFSLTQAPYPALRLRATQVWPGFPGSWAYNGWLGAAAEFVLGHSHMHCGRHSRGLCRSGRMERRCLNICSRSLAGGWLPGKT
jgi:hypothetical protein